MEKLARVTALEGEWALLEVDHASGGCGRCNEPGGCRGGVLNQVFPKACQPLRLRNDIAARPGERVVVRIAEGGVLRAVLLAYLLPLFVAIVFAWCGTRMGGDLAAVAGAVLGLVVGYAVTRTLQRTHLGEMQPRMQRASDSDIGRGPGD